MDYHSCFQDGNGGQGTMHFFKTVMCSAYTCPRHVGFHHLCDIYPLRGYTLDSLLPDRK
jgi:hypothetical protein